MVGYCWLRLKAIFHFKLLIGMMGLLKKAVGVLESKEKTFRVKAGAELDKARVERFAFNQRRMEVWLTGFVKIRVQEELVKAKTSQILTFSDELCLSPPASLALTEARLSPLFDSEDPDVTEEIERFSTWIEERIAPTEDEVTVVARKKADGFLVEVYDVMQNIQDLQD